MVTPARFERATPGLGILCSILLSYGAIRATLARLLTGATALALLLPVSATAAGGKQTHPCQSATYLTGRLLAGATSDRFQITGSRQVYRLAGIASDTALPLPSGQTVGLFAPAEKPDRYGRIAVQAFSGTHWLQARPLRKGHAMVRPDGQSAACMHALLAVEAPQTAMSANDIAAIEGRAGLFTVISGRVHSIGNRKRRLYLNFGQKWDEDVTASVAKTGRNRFRGDVDHLAELEGRRVEIRGTVELNGGPVIRLEDAAQIRVLPAD